jgi:transcriptional regulator with XRE-family HTH domain
MKVEFRYGKKIQQLHDERAWTQEQLAAIAGVETRTIQRVEKDQTKNQETLLAIAAAFDVGLDAIRTKWRVAESRLLRTWLVTSYNEFVRVQEAHPWQMSYRSVIAPFTEEGQIQADELVNQIFADREYIEPYETDLWNCYIRSIKEPLQSLLGMGLAIFILDERRDLLLSSIGDLKPLSDYMDWSVQHTTPIPREHYGAVEQTERAKYNSRSRRRIRSIHRTSWVPAGLPTGEGSCSSKTLHPKLPRFMKFQLKAAARRH